MKERDVVLMAIARRSEVMGRLEGVWKVNRGDNQHPIPLNPP